MNKSSKVAIIGAGIAGLAATKRLSELGHHCVLIDKGREPGGRMATRHLNDFAFDHGAQYFTARGTNFIEVVEELNETGHCGLWDDGKYVGIPRMNSFGRGLLGNHGICLETEVTGLKKINSGWLLDHHRQKREIEANGEFDTVLLALPAPQISALILNTPIQLPEISEVVYAPCWTLMLVLKDDVLPMSSYTRLENGPISWIAKDSSKPGRTEAGGVRFVVQASPRWSRNNLEKSSDWVTSALLDFVQVHFPTTIRPYYSLAHRWRYAMVERAAGKACLWDGAQRVGACGDWCIGPRIEAAFDSGIAMAKKVSIELQALS